ncbi:MAG TPA: HAD hydrolase family protein [Blastocatellia bacterium]|nr:HAD hydrolase family protein [Blastocatellia bacterium]
MRFGILALDYDGTIARDGVLDPGVRAAIEELRSTGIVVVLVTGRILSHLRSLMGDLRLFDAIVAENGAVVAFPGAGRSAVLGHAPQPAFLDELNRRGVKFDRGQCVVEADANLAHQILSIISDLELPLVLLFNRGRLMVLPQAISKATGLRHALRAMRLSEHNALAIGDAENDHQLLEACEVGVAVGWGSEALKRTADVVIEGNGPAAVADYIRQAARHLKLSPQRTGRQLLLGTNEKGQPLSLAVRGRNVLIAGDSQTGKSWVAGLLCEHLILQHYCVCVIDPEGDYRTLESLPGVIVLGGEDPPPQARDITRALRYPDVSLVLDLSRLRMRQKREYVTSLLLLLKELRRETGLPHRIIVDEAHYFLHDAGVIRLLDLELAGYTLVTYQVSSIHPEILAATEAIIVTRESDPREVRALRALQGGNGDVAEWEKVLGNLAVNEAVLLPNTEEACGKLCKFYVAPRLTSHVRHEHKYLDMPLPETRAFIFVQNGVPTGRRARTLKEFTAILAVAPPEMLDGHLRAGDFSRWIADVFRDYALSSQLENIERQYRTGQVPDINDAMIQVVQDRYNLTARA